MWIKSVLQKVGYELVYAMFGCFVSMNTKMNRLLVSRINVLFEHHKFLTLIVSDLEELQSIIQEVKYRSGLQSAKLIRQLRRRDRLCHKRQKNCDIITACLQAVSQKRRKANASFFFTTKHAIINYNQTFSLKQRLYRSGLVSGFFCGNLCSFILQGCWCWGRSISLSLSSSSYRKVVLISLLNRSFSWCEFWQVYRCRHWRWNLTRFWLFIVYFVTIKKLSTFIPNPPLASAKPTEANSAANQNL